MPKRMRAAALELLERVRIGLDLPSRGEVLALAERLETISRQLNTLETKQAEDEIKRAEDEIKRVEDSMIVAALREEADNVKALGAAKAKARAKKAASKKAKAPSAKKVNKASKAATKSATKAIAKSATRALLKDVATKSAQKPAASAVGAKTRTIKKPTHGAGKATFKASGAEKKSS